MSLLQKYMEDPEAAKLVVQGELIMEVTETLCELMEKEKISRKELADRLGKSKGFVSQLLNGGRNLTLRTVADIVHVLGYKVSLMPYKKRREKPVNVISESQTWNIRHERGVQSWEMGPLEISFPDNYYSDFIAAILR